MLDSLIEFALDNWLGLVAGIVVLIVTNLVAVSVRKLFPHSIGGALSESRLGIWPNYKSIKQSFYDYESIEGSY